MRRGEQIMGVEWDVDYRNIWQVKASSHALSASMCRYSGAPVPKQVSRKRFSSPGWLDGAGERIRTVDIHLGKVTLYH